MKSIVKHCQKLRNENNQKVGVVFYEGQLVIKVVEFYLQDDEAVIPSFTKTGLSKSITKFFPATWTSVEYLVQ